METKTDLLIEFITNRIKELSLTKNIRKKRNPCTKCVKRLSTHCSGLCRVCISNQRKFRQRSHTQTQSHTQSRAQPDFQTPVQTNTQTFREKGVYVGGVRAGFAELFAKANVSARQCAAAFNIVGRALQINSTAIPKPDRKTTQNCAIEASICVDFEMAKKLSKSRDIFVGIDETSLRDKRSFIEIEFGGIHNSEQWSYVFSLQEVCTHSAKGMLILIKKTFKYIRSLQRLQNAREIHIWQIKSIVFDWTAANTGCRGGLYVLLKNYINEKYEKYGDSSVQYQNSK